MAELWSVKPEQFPSERWVCSFSLISITELTLVGRESIFVAPQTFFAYKYLLVQDKNLAWDRERCIHLLDCCQMLLRAWQTPTSSQRMWFPSPTYLSVFFSPGQSLYTHSRVWLRRIWRTLGCPRGEWSMGISLCLVITRKSEKSKLRLTQAN